MALSTNSQHNKQKPFFVKEKNSFPVTYLNIKSDNESISLLRSKKMLNM